MGTPIKVFRTSGSAPEDLLISAYAQVEGGGGYRQIVFRAGRVDYLFEIDKERSGITLQNGVTIVARRGIAALRGQIFEGGGGFENVLDLTGVTGEEAGEAAPVRLSKEFNPAVPRPAIQEAPKDAPLAIDLFVRFRQDDRNFKRIRIYDTQIDYYEPNAANAQKETFICLKKDMKIEDRDKFWFSLSLPNFTRLLNDAKANRRTHLDLTTLTQPPPDKVFKMGEA